MINGCFFIDLEKHINLKEFDSLHTEICRGLATAKHLAVDGLQKINPGSVNPTAQGHSVIPLYEAYSHWDSLPDSDPLKIAGQGLDYNQLTTYLKFAFGGYDLYSFYKILDADFQVDGIGEIENHFPNLVKWILSFEQQGIFRTLHSASLMVLEAGGIPWEHNDPETSTEDSDNFIPEFIHFKTDLNRPFYMVGAESRTYVNTRVAWWNERDWHGGEPINRPTYTLRINGRFTEEFKTLILK
jgi:hypothetical protein